MEGNVSRYGNDARACAVNALYYGERENAYGDANINAALSECGLDRRDSALATALYYGVLQNRIFLDRCISKFSDLKLKKVHPRVLEILRVGAYQLLFMDKIPDSAAVNEAVKLAKATKNGYAAGYINALLRKIAASKGELKNIDEPDRLTRLSVEYSHPAELVKLLADSLPGTDIEALLRENNNVPPVSIRVNRLKTEPEALLKRLAGEGFSVRADPELPECLYLENCGAVTAIDAYNEGLFSVQDKASMLAVRALDPRAGGFIIDGCAAPGGKSLYAAELTENGAEILSCDIYAGKLSQIERNAERLGITSVKTLVCDAAAPREEYFGKADAVLADVPCSGLGIIRKKPDIRYKDLCEIAALPRLQLKILKSLTKYVRPGGTIVYSTCTILPRENEAVVREFLSGAPDFSLSPFFTGQSFAAPEGMLTLYPHINGTDGFFICKMTRKL